MTLLELTVSLTLIAAAGAITAQTLLWSRGLTRTADEERLAYHEAANCLEELAQLGYDALTPQRAATRRLAEDAATILGRGELRAQVTPLDDEWRAKRVTVEISWDAMPSQPRRSIRLSTLVYPRSPPPAGPPPAGKEKP